MGTMRYKPSDKVRIKSLDWYNENKDEYGYVRCIDFLFTPEHSKYCGCEFTISHITEFQIPSYVMESNGHEWTDEMIEGLAEEEVDLIPKFGEYSDNEPLDVPTMTTDFVKEHGLPCPEGYQFVDENGNVINATKIVLEKKSPKTNDVIKWLREHDMNKYINVLYSGMCSIRFDTEELIKDIIETIGDE